MLDNAHADALAVAILDAVGVTTPASIAKAKTAIEIFYAHLKADILITIAASSIVTVGSATTQTGPAAPIGLTPA
jgi:hypothetical protein